MASAGKPLSASPSSARKISRLLHCSTSAQAIPSSAARPSAATITGLRPQLSASAPDTSRHRARLWVVSESARLLLAADTRKCAANNGSRGCTQ